ncbi:MAG: YihY/virulence factor BrkB family protein [Saprospiraceae bacterium]|nr:YihY/virulence factor BrkB family protein [Saprospiraceae bacterium]
MKKKFENFVLWILDLPILKQLIQFAKNTTLPGFQGVSLFSTFSFIVKELKRNDINTRAGAMSFSFFLALFPSLIFLFTLSAYLPKNWDFISEMENSLNSILPNQTQDYLWKNIVAGLRPKAKGSILSIGFLLAIFFASNGMLTMMRGFDKTYRTSFRKRTFIESHSVAFILTVLFGVLLILSIVVIIVGNKFISWLFAIVKLSAMSVFLIGALKYVILFILFYLTVDIIYRIGPALKKPMKNYSPGTIFATIASILSSILFGYFVDNFSTYHKVYGTISALIITLIWIRLNVLIILLGFELNAAIIVNRDLMEIVDKDSYEENT